MKMLLRLDEDAAASKWKFCCIKMKISLRLDESLAPYKWKFRPDDSFFDGAVALLCSDGREKKDLREYSPPPLNGVILYS